MGHKERIQNNDNCTKGIIVFMKNELVSDTLFFFKGRHVAALKNGVFN